MPGDWLDIVLLVLTVMFAVSGYRHGFTVVVLSLTGFVCGMAAGARIAAGVSRSLGSDVSWQAFVAVLVVFAAAVAGMLLASWLGAGLRLRLRLGQVTFLDSLGGAAVNGLAVLVIAGLIAPYASGADSATVSGQVDDSLVLGALSRMMPRGAALGGLVNAGLYTRLLGSVAAGTAGLPPASAAVLRSRAVAQAGYSVLKIKGVARLCPLGPPEAVEGSGFVIGPGHVLTNAHVVAGLTRRPEVIAASGRAYAARVVLYDPRRDVAVLDVPGLQARALHFAGPARYGASAVMAGYPHNRGLTLKAATIGWSRIAVMEGIRKIAGAHWQVYPIRADVEPGNSGGPLLAPDGSVYGVVFALSGATPGTGYALTAGEVASDADAGEHDVSAVQTPPSLTC